MSDTSTSVPPAQDPSGRAAPGAQHGGRLVRRTFLIALVLVCGGLLTSAVVELVFRYRESVEAIGALQREMAQGAAFKIQQFVQDIEHTLRAATQTQEIVTSGLTGLCTKSPVRNLTYRSMRTFWSHFDSFSRPYRPF